MSLKLRASSCRRMLSVSLVDPQELKDQVATLFYQNLGFGLEFGSCRVLPPHTAAGNKLWLTALQNDQEEQLTGFCSWHAFLAAAAANAAVMFILSAIKS